MDIANFSILFLLGGFSVGGVERVTVVLANEFARRGRRVVIAAFRFENRSLLVDLDAAVRVVELSHGGLGPGNAQRLRQVLKDERVGAIINQWCTPFSVTMFCRWAARGLGVKLISAHHNLPTTNKRIQDSTGWRKKMWKVVTAVSLRLVYEFSDAYVLLSGTFVNPFKLFISRQCADKIRVIPNPLTLAPCLREKENVLLYVGRLEETQKRFSRVIDIWRELSLCLSDWQLEVVGDGPDRGYYEESSRGIARVVFHGFQNPSDYYARAKILIMTSEFEGLPLTPIEAMASGCVPVVFGSFASAADLVDGAIVLPTPFERAAFVEQISNLAANDTLLSHWQAQARRAGAKFGVDTVVKRWEAVLK